MRNKPGIVILMAVACAVSMLLGAPDCLAAVDVLTTHTVLQSIAEEVGGEHVSVSSLATGREDPHAIQAKPSYMIKARKADLLIKVGMEMEIGYEQLIIDGSRNYGIRLGQPGHLDVSTGVLRLEVPTTRVDRSMGDVHPLGNPHYWLDPCNARIVARSIADRLSAIDPEHSSDYKAGCADFTRRIDTAMFGEKAVDELGGSRLWKLRQSGELDRELDKLELTDDVDTWHKRSKRFAGMRLITYHRSWGYLANRFGLDIVAELEPKPGIPPSPGHLLHVVEIAKQQGSGIILMEPYYNRRAADFVAEKIGAKVVVAANAINGQPGVDDYFALIDNVLQQLEDTPASRR